MCHDEPRDPSKPSKYDIDHVLENTAPSTKQEGLPPNPLAPAFDQQQAEHQSLQDTRMGMGLHAAPQTIQDGVSDSLQANSNSAALGQGFEGSNQSCELGCLVLLIQNTSDPVCSPRLRRLEPWRL